MSESGRLSTINTFKALAATTIACGALFVPTAAEAKLTLSTDSQGTLKWVSGRWHISASDGVTASERALGSRTYSRRNYTGNCQWVWSDLGLVVEFNGYEHSDCSDAFDSGGYEEHVTYVIVKGRNGARAWRTNKGLSLGATRRRLRRAYPRTLFAGQLGLFGWQSYTDFFFETSFARFSRGRIVEMRFQFFN